MPTNEHDATDESQQEEGMSHRSTRMYLRFAAMILTGMVVMYVVMFFGTYAWDHVRWSESRLFMTLTMGGAMGLVMLAWMRRMYKSTKANLAVVAVSALLLVGGVALDRSQVTVTDTDFMSGMIPHHSLAITRSERAHLSDVRVCELAVEISEAQRREIYEMEWLLADIERNGLARSAREAAERAVPERDFAAERECPGG